MIHELDVVALTRDISGTHLKKGDLGTVVLVYGNNEAYMVEFVLQTGFTAALEDLKSDDVRAVKKGELKSGKYREWNPEWTTDETGDIPSISEMKDWGPSPDGSRTDAHYLANVHGSIN